MNFNSNITLKDSLKTPTGTNNSLDSASGCQNESDSGEGSLKHELNNLADRRIDQDSRKEEGKVSQNA